MLRWAERYQIPVVMVRSHTKLDSLGAEYGRLGSAVFVRWSGKDLKAGRLMSECLAAETRNAVRLLGVRAAAGAFSPFVGTAAYWRRRRNVLLPSCATAVTRRDILRPSSRRCRPSCIFTHGLYVTLRGRRALSTRQARGGPPKT